MKVFLNIIILSLIGLFSSTYLFNLSPIDYRGSIEIETPVEISTLHLESNEKKVMNPKSIVINHVAQNEEIIKSVSNSIFSLDVYKDNVMVKSGIMGLELVSPSVNMSISVNNDNPIVTTLDISQDKLGLEDGTYKFVFNSNLISNSNNSSLAVEVTYDTLGNYYAATNQAPDGTKGLTLYFATEDEHDTLIPVTRFVVEDKSLTRMAIEQLQNGPVNKGMYSVIKDVTNTTYNNGNVVIDIPSSYTAYNEGTHGSSLAYDAFVKTIFDVDRYWPINTITFTVDRKHVDTYFHDLVSESINQLPNKERNYLIYRAYKLDGRYYLFDYKPEQSDEILESDAIEIKAQKLFDAYKDAGISYGMNPIPENITLKGASQQGSVLTLDFDGEFLNAYKNKEDLKQMMIESILYTFTTIPGVDSIKITVNGNELKNFTDFPDGRNLTGILYPPEFINPEIVQTAQ